MLSLLYLVYFFSTNIPIKLQQAKWQADTLNYSTSISIQHDEE